MTASKLFKILVINPNTSVAITESLKPFLSAIDLPHTSLSYWTCPTGPPILRTQADISSSALHSLQPLLAIAADYDGFLIACYAEHPLVPLLKTYVGARPVVGIFEASITTALHLLAPNSKFAILTTGKAYEPLLADGARRFLGAEKGAAAVSDRFAGVVASGIDVDDLNAKSWTVVREKLVVATRRVVSGGDVSVLCLGGVILAGMEDWVRDACVMELGVEMGSRVRVVDQLVAGVMTLEGLVHIES